MATVSRRQFAALAAVGGLTALPGMRALAPTGALTVAAVLDRLKAELGGDWKPDGPDGLRAGDVSTPVTGVVTTALPTLLVLRQAVAAGANLVITSEPTFFARADKPVPATPDPIFTAKAKFLRENNLAVVRIGEAWRRRPLDGFSAGLAKSLGWPEPGSGSRMEVPETTLSALSAHVKSSLRMRGGMRVVGDPALRIRTVGLLPGSTPLQAALDTLPHVDAVVAGEMREWETVEYVRDAVALGGKKALIMVGRVVSEEPGMQACAEWLKGVVSEVQSTWIDAGDPYWRPTA